MSEESMQESYDDTQVPVNEKEASEQIDKYLKEAYAAINAAEALADKFGIYFHFSVEYGMGGSYDGEEQQWNPSSQSC